MMVAAVAVKTEKDYLALASQRAHTTSRVKSFRRVFVYARNKKGKTRLGLSTGRDNILVIDPENGTDLMKSLDAFVWPIAKWEDMQEVYGALRTGKLSPNHILQGESSIPFSWVAVDGLTRMNNMALKYVMRVQEEKDLDRQPGFVDRRDYGKSGELMKQMILNFHTLKLNVYYTSQEKMITDSSTFDDDEDAENSDAYFVPDLPNAVRGMMNSQAEVIGRLYVVKVDGKEGPVKQRRLQIGLHEKYDTGFRSDFSLPDTIKRPTLPKLVSLIEEGE
jgi:AAA domain